MGTVICLLLLSCSSGPERQESSKCTPWIVEASDEPLEVSLLGGHWRFDGNALLVGCRETLDTLTASERSRAAEVVVQVVAEKNLGILNRAEREFRMAAVAQINETVGRAIVTDVWMEFSFSEYE